MKKYLFLFYILLIISLLLPTAELLAQGKKPKLQYWSGLVQKKSWTKSTQSYCAQGSDYWVLVISATKTREKREFVLQNEDTAIASFSPWEGKQIDFQGYVETKYIIPPKDDGRSQRLVNTSLDGKEETFSCEVLVVKKVMSAKK